MNVWIDIDDSYLYFTRLTVKNFRKSDKCGKKYGLKWFVFMVWLKMDLSYVNVK